MPTGVSYDTAIFASGSYRLSVVISSTSDLMHESVFIIHSSVNKYELGIFNFFRMFSFIFFVL